MRAAGFVLAGGRSSRMGRDKAHLRFGSHLLVEIAAGSVAQVTGNVALLGDPTLFADLPFECLGDLRPGLGPIGGLEAALASGRGDQNLVVACDMPGVQAAHLSLLLKVANETGALCTVVLDQGGRRHPLCAVYHRDALPLVRSALDAGRLRLFDLVEELKAVEVRIDSVLCNLNTPEQWSAWRAAQLV